MNMAMYHSLDRLRQMLDSLDHSNVDVEIYRVLDAIYAALEVATVASDPRMTMVDPSKLADLMTQQDPTKPAKKGGNAKDEGTAYLTGPNVYL